MSLTFLAAGGTGELIGIVLVTVFILIAWFVSSQYAERRRKIWAETAESLGLTRLGDDHIGGELDGSEVEAKMYSQGSGKNKRTYTRVRASGHLPDDVQFAAEGFFSTLFGEDLLVGDEAFDKAVKVRGDRGSALALLDAPMRAMVLNAVGDGWVFGNGAWSYTVQKNLDKELEPLLRRGAALANVLRDAATQLLQRLVERVRGDPNPGVRRFALEHLVNRYATSRAVEIAARSALHDSDAAVRLIAAKHLSDPEVLVALTSDAALAGALRADALTACEQHSDHPEVVFALGALTDELGRGGMPTPLREALANALGRVRERRAEATLIGLLEDAEDEVRLAAIQSLGRVGTVTAVPSLVPLRDRFMAFASRQAGEAKDAILAIQARAGRAEAGALALSEDGGGLALTEPSEEGSRVSERVEHEPSQEA